MLTTVASTVDYVRGSIFDPVNLPRVRISTEVAGLVDEEALYGFLARSVGIRRGEDAPVRGLSEYHVARQALAHMIMCCRAVKTGHARPPPEPVMPPILVGDKIVRDILALCSAATHVASLTQRRAYVVKFQNTYVDTTEDAARVLEILFMRLTRNLVCFNEGVMELIGFSQRFMTSLDAAKVVFGSEDADGDGPILVRPAAARACRSRHQEDAQLADVKRRYAERALQWARQADVYLASPAERVPVHRAHAALLGDLRKVVDTPVGCGEDAPPFERIHNRAALAVRVAQGLIEVYWGQVCLPNAEEESLVPALRDKMFVCLNNASLYADGVFVPVEQ